MIPDDSGPDDAKLLELSLDQVAKLQQKARTKVGGNGDDGGGEGVAALCGGKCGVISKTGLENLVLQARVTYRNIFVHCL